MATATCCQQGRQWVDMVEPPSLTFDSENREIHFCPFCGEPVSLVRAPDAFVASLLKAKTSLRICFDVDGVICDNHDPSTPYAKRDEYPWVADVFRQLQEAGHLIIIQTARYMKQTQGDQEEAFSRGFRELRKWLMDHTIPYDEIYLGKASADIYVDDRGCRIESRRGTIDWEHRLIPQINKLAG